MVVLALFIILCTVAAANHVVPLLPAQGWLNASVAVMALAASIVALASVLPWSNVLLAGALAAFMGGLAHAISAVTGFPLGRGEFTPQAGPMLLGLIPWWLPAAWAVIALSARGTARLLLHHSQDHPRHGYRVILIATGLAIFTSMMLQTFAVDCAHLWKSESLSPLGNAGYLLHVVVQIAITPLLIDKFPGQRPKNFQPLLVWAGPNVFFLTGIVLT